MSNRITIILLCTLFVQQLTAQIDHTPRFSRLLEEAQLDFYEPLENSYRDVPVWKEAAHYQPYDFAIRSRRDHLEIRYQILPYRDNDLKFAAPQVEAVRLAMHLATNQDESIISGFSIDEEELKTDFNADWGKVFIFQPKKSFSNRPHCKMLALYREGKGLAFVFFLFDQPSQEVDNRFVALRFKDNTY
ncbi:MAG: hypothetical protein ACK4RS_01805 [Thiothrix sp.]